MERRWAGLLGICAVVMTASLGMGSVPVQGGILDWDFTVTYKVQEDYQNVSSHSLVGTYTHTINCTSGWEEESSTATSTSDSEDHIKIKVDYDTATLRRRNQSDGTVVIRDYGCPDYTLEDIPELPSGWIRKTNCEPETGGDNDNCKRDEEKAGTTTFAPGVQEFTFPFDMFLSNDGVIVEALAGGVNQNDVTPYTGHVVAEAFDPDGDRVAWARTCDALYGVCWDSGRADTGFGEYEDCVGCAWHLSGEAGSFEGTPVGPIGNWGAFAHASK